MAKQASAQALTQTLKPSSEDTSKQRTRKCANACITLDNTVENHKRAKWLLGANSKQSQVAAFAFRLGEIFHSPDLRRNLRVIKRNTARPMYRCQM